MIVSQRKRGDNRDKICAFQGGWAGGQSGKSSKYAMFHEKRHDNKISNVKILLSRDFVVMAQAPSFASENLKNSANHCLQNQGFPPDSEVSV